MDIVDKEYIENKTINNLTSKKLFTGTYNISKIDEILNDGIYIITNTRNDGSIVCPFLLQVLNNISNDNINLCRQTLYDSVDGVFKVRYKDITNNTAWSDWNAVRIYGKYIKDNTITRDKIDKSDTGLFKMYTTGDYDILTETGVYTVWGVDSNDKRVTSLLFVSNLKSYNKDYEIIQKRIGTQSNKLEERRYSNGSWSNWTEIPIYIGSEQITLTHLSQRLRFPFSHQNINVLDVLGNFDTIINCVGGLYNGIVFPTFAIQYVTSNPNGDNIDYKRQLVYDANLGTFKYRSKNLNTNVFDDWTPIPIPQTSVYYRSYLQSERIDALTVSGLYVLTNNSAINYSTLAEFIVVHNNTLGQVFQTHYGGNGNIKGRIGNIQSDGTVVWNNWVIKAYTYNISYDNNGMYRYNDFTNSWLEMTTDDFTKIINNIHLPNIKCKCRVKHGTNNYSACDVKLYKQNILIISYFDFDANQTTYIKVWLENDVIKTNKKTITFES